MTVACAGRIVVTRGGTRSGAGSGSGSGSGTGGALAHLLWWDPSVRAVLVERDGPDCTDADYDAYVDLVRETIELTGSDAALLVHERAMLT